MKHRVNLRALKINGHDPRLSKSFLLLSSELSQLNGSLPAKIDWNALEEQCLQLFHEYGYDLQSGVWFCLISLRLKSWKGLALALDLLSTAFSQNSQRCWPPIAAVQQRQYLVDWFSANVSTHIYTLNYGPENAADMQRVERSIAVLCAWSKSLQARSQDSLKNLHYFLQVRCRTVPYPSPLKTETAFDAAEENGVKEEVKPVAPQDKKNPPDNSTAPEWVSVPDVKLTLSPQPRPWLWALSGTAAGIVMTVAVASLWIYAHLPSATEQAIAPLAALQHLEQKLDSAWSPLSPSSLVEQKQAMLQQAAPVMAWVSDQPADLVLKQGDFLSRKLEKAYPGNAVSAEWQRSMKDKSDSILALDRFVQMNKQLDELDARLLNAERTRNNYLTVSELKTAVYQMRQELQAGGVPIEMLLWQLQHNQENNKPSNSALLKDVSQRLNAYNALYFQLSLRK